MNAALRVLAVVLTVLAAMPAGATSRSKSWPQTLGAERSGAVVRELKFEQSRILVTFTPSDFQLPEKHLLDWVLRSARATATFFGRFPVAEVRISLEADQRRGRRRRRRLGIAGRAHPHRGRAQDHGHARSRATARWCTR